MRLRTLPCLLALALPYAALADGPAKDASDLTRQSNQQWLQRLPFDDRSDFDNARRGLLEAVDQPVVNADGKTVWDLQRYAFLKGEAPATVNPSLWRIPSSTPSPGCSRSAKASTRCAAWTWPT